MRKLILEPGERGHKNYDRETLRRHRLEIARLRFRHRLGTDKAFAIDRFGCACTTQVYVVHDGTFCKVGISDRFAERIAQMQCGNPYELTVESLGPKLSTAKAAPRPRARRMVSGDAC